MTTIRAKIFDADGQHVGNYIGDAARLAASTPAGGSAEIVDPPQPSEPNEADGD